MDIPYRSSEKTEPFIDWRKLPALRLFILLIPFIIIGYYVHVHLWTFFAIILSCGIISFILLYKKHTKSAYLFACSIIGLYIGYGAYSTVVHTPDVMIEPLPANFQGQIERIMRSDTLSLRLLCTGTVDCKELSPIKNARIIVTLMKPNKRVKHFVPGAYVSMYGKAHIPRKQFLPTDFDEQTYCKGLEIACMFSAFSDNCSLLKESENWRLYLHTVTADVKNRISSIFPSSTEGLMIALLMGDKTNIAPEIMAQYSLAGTAHVLAVSGLHITIISLIILLPLGFVTNRLLKLSIFTIALTLFVLMTGLEASAIRSGLMSVLIMTAYTFQRKPVLLNILALTVIIILIVQPSMIFSIGFQLSVFAVFGISLLYKKVYEVLTLIVNNRGVNNIGVRYCYESLSITLSATVFVSLITAIYFQTFSIISPLANLFIVPLSSLAMVFGFIAVVFSYFSFGLAELYAACASLLITVSDTMNAKAAEIPYAAIKGSTAIMFAMLTTVCLLYISFSSNRRNILFRITACCLLIGMVIILQKDYANTEPLIIAPRQYMVMAHIGLDSDTSFVLLADRKPHLQPKNDMALIQYLENIPGHLIIGKRGNCSEWISVQVSKKRTTDIMPVNDDLYKKVIKAIHQPKFHTLIHN